MCRSIAPPLGRAAADHTTDAVFGHEVEGALGAALDADPRLRATSLGRCTAGYGA